MTLYLRILQYLRPHAGLFGASIVAMVVFAALDAFSFTLLIPFLDVLFNGGARVAQAGEVFGDSGMIDRMLAWAVGDLVAQNAPMEALRNVVLLLFGVFLVKNVALYVQQYTTALVQGRVTRDMRNDIYQHLLRLDFPFFQRTRAGQIISRVTNDVDGMRALVTGNLAKALSSAIQAIFYLAVLVLLSWKLTLVALLFIPPMFGLWGVSASGYGSACCGCSTLWVRFPRRFRKR